MSGSTGFSYVVKNVGPVAVPLIETIYIYQYQFLPAYLYLQHHFIHLLFSPPPYYLVDLFETNLQLFLFFNFSGTSG